MLRHPSAFRAAPHPDALLRKWLRILESEGNGSPAWRIAGLQAQLTHDYSKRFDPGECSRAASCAREHTWSLAYMEWT
jgi:hypothetical protein